MSTAERLTVARNLEKSLRQTKAAVMKVVIFTFSLIILLEWL